MSFLHKIKSRKTLLVIIVFLIFSNYLTILYYQKKLPSFVYTVKRLIFNSNTNKQKTSIKAIEKRQKVSNILSQEANRQVVESDNFEVIPTPISTEINSQKEFSINDILENDENIEIIKYESPRFEEGKLKDYLSKVPSTKIYVLIEFNNFIDDETLFFLKNNKIKPVPSFANKSYKNRNFGLFYIYYKQLRKIYKTENRFIKNAYILNQYTATGYYTLKAKNSSEIDGISLKVKLPYSKKAFELLDKKTSITGLVKSATTKKVIQNNKALVETSLKENQEIAFRNKVKYLISLEKGLEGFIGIEGRDLYLKQYTELMLKEYSDIYREFTQLSNEKIISSDYVQSIIERLDTKQTISYIWKQIKRRLDKDINYDWEKRKLFFRGALPYKNIKDMYLNVEELSETRLGACPERTPLEISILRQIGIAARSSTRLYHIYTEIFIPDKGWITTSYILNEIPLCVSNNNRMGYFTSWEPEHIINLKWSGILYPKIVKTLTRK